MNSQKPYTPTSLHRHIRSHSVFVFKVGTGNFGSGVLVTLADRVFALSAAHVIEADVDINLGIIPHETRFTILDKWLDDETDIGFIELNPSEVKFRLSEASSPFAIGGVGAASIPAKKTTLALCGFPSGESTITDRGREIPATYITVAMLSLEQWPDDIRARYDPTKTFVVPYGPKWGGSFLDGNKNPREPISPFGLSGSGLWLYDPETEEAEKPIYSLVGVQHSYSPSHQVILGTLLEELTNRLKAHYRIDIPRVTNVGAA